MAYRGMSDLSKKCKQFLLDTKGFTKSDRLYVWCDFSEYLTHNRIYIDAEKLFVTYKSGQRRFHFRVPKDIFDNWELMKERNKKLKKITNEISSCGVKNLQ